MYVKEVVADPPFVVTVMLTGPRVEAAGMAAEIWLSESTWKVAATEPNETATAPKAYGSTLVGPKYNQQD
jgi:hypothetical protein